MESHASSAAAFVEGGVQDACDDSCSICLDVFSDSNPITVTSCKHEYHLQCILEWAQRSKECPMCWQPLKLEDANSQELLNAVEHERVAMTSALHRNAAGGFELRHVPVFTNDSDFEERIMRHLAAAARAHHFARRESLRNSTQDHTQVVMTRVPLPPGAQVRSGGNFSSLSAVGPSRENLTPQTTSPSTPSRDTGRIDNSRYTTETEPGEENQQKSALSELFSLSESIKSRFVAASTRYKETFTRTTKGWKERLRTQNNGIHDIGARAREMGVGVARVLERVSTDPGGKRRVEDDESPVTESKAQPDNKGASESSGSASGINAETSRSTDNHLESQEPSIQLPAGTI